MTEDLTRLAIHWKHTGDAEFPYAAEVDGQRYTVRLNDFPAEPLYTVLSGGAELFDLEDWPPAWEMPAPPQALLALLTPKHGPRCTGAVRLAATSGRGDPVASLALDGSQVIAGPSRRLDLATLQEQPASPGSGQPRPATVPLEDGERLLAVASEPGVALSAMGTASGDEVRLHRLHARRREGLAVCQPPTLAGALSPSGKGALVLFEGGRVLFYDLVTRAFPGSASARSPGQGKRACLDLARDGRRWLAAAGAHAEVRVMGDATAVATVDLAPLGDEITCALFLPDASGFLVGTAQGMVMRFELLLDRVGSSHEARVAAIADAVDAALAGTGWGRFAPRVQVYDARTAGERTTLYFVADHYEYHQAQSGSDWAEHTLCAGHATFEGDRCLEAQVGTMDRSRLTERDAEGYGDAAVLAAFRDATARTRSSSTVVPGGDAIQRAFDAHFAGDRLVLVEKALHQAAGSFSVNGWDVRYRFGEEAGTVCLDAFARNRLTNDRLYRVYADGRVEFVGSSTDGVLPEQDEEFYDEVRRRMGGPGS